MSASLVGSEMCIRDRWTSTDTERLRRMMCYMHQRNDLRLVGWCGDAPDPVSYTHLTLPTICSV
eukprot:3570463-Alexandrium_andersonii.AAC.1